MATEAELASGNIPEEPKAPEGEAKPKEGPVPNADLDAIRAENASLRESVQKATKDAAASQAYVQEIVSRLQAAAATRGMASEENGEPGPSLSDRMSQDPVSVLDEHFAARMAPLINQSLEYQVNQARELFEQRMSTDEEFNEYKGELEEFMKGIPPQVKAQPKAWADGLNFIRARHIDEIVEKRSKRTLARDKAAFVEGQGASATTPKGPVMLNADQKAIAKGLGIPEDEYLKWMNP